MLGLFFGSAFSRLFAIPFAIFGGIAAIVAICGCIRCMSCRLRDCLCCKRFLRATGHDQFDDFEAIVLVHEAVFDKKKEAKLTTRVRITAGSHTVNTDPNSNGIFQQPLHVTVEQGTRTVVVDLLDSHSRLIATLPLDTMEHILGATVQSEVVYTMKQKGKGVRHPKIKLTIIVNAACDEESALLAGVSSEVDIFMRQQLHKAHQQGKKDEGLSEMDLLKDACSGPLELFKGLGKTTSIYAAVLGPPTSRRWALGLWSDKHRFDAKSRAIQEVALLQVQSVHADPERHHVFVINYVDDNRHRQILTLRRIDRGRDVWVEMLHVLVQKVHESKKAERQEKSTKSPESSFVSSKKKTIRF